MKFLLLIGMYFLSWYYWVKYKNEIWGFNGSWLKSGINNFNDDDDDGFGKFLW